jgi:hypothetical protein
MPEVDQQATVGRARLLDHRPERREVGHRPEREELERHRERPGPLAQRGEPGHHGLQRLRPDQAAFTVRHPERPRDVEDRLFLGLLVGTPEAAPVGEVLDFGQPHPVGAEDLQHRRVVEARPLRVPVVLGPDPDPGEPRPRRHPHALGEAHGRAQAVGAEDQRLVGVEDGHGRSVGALVKPPSVLLAGLPTVGVTGEPLALRALSVDGARLGVARVPVHRPPADRHLLAAVVAGDRADHRGVDPS